VSLVDAFITAALQALGRRLSRVRLRVTHGYPEHVGGPRSVQITLTNRSRRTVSVTRIWLATEPPVEILPTSQPDIISPTGTLSIAISAIGVPPHADLQRCGRAELSDGRVLKSRP
jgi:hypothetical protein